MIVYRTLSEPTVLANNQGDIAYGVLCLLEDREDYILFTDEDTAWQFFHDVNMKWFPIRIGQEDEG